MRAALRNVVAITMITTLATGFSGISGDRAARNGRDRRLSEILRVSLPSPPTFSGLVKAEIEVTFSGAPGMPFGSYKFMLKEGAESETSQTTGMATFWNVRAPSDHLGVLYGENTPVVEVHNLDIFASSNRGRGRGSLLMREALEWFRNKSFQTELSGGIVLFSRDTSDIPSLYENWGFKRTDPDFPNLWSMLVVRNDLVLEESTRTRAITAAKNYL